MQIQDRLKSFVLRKGRITSNQKRAIDTLWDKYILDSNKEVKNISVAESIQTGDGFA